MAGKTLIIRVGGLDADLTEFVDVWKRAERGEAVEASYSLTFESLGGWLSTLTPKRWELLNYLHEHGPMTIYALAKGLRRDYKNVHGDVRALEELGIIVRTADGKIEVPWDKIEAHMQLAA